MSNVLVKGDKDIFYYKYTDSYKFFIVNPVNTAGIMGKGLALQFKKRMPSHFENYKEALLNEELSVGHVFIDKSNQVIAFPTKKHWRSKSNIEDIRTALKDMHIQALKNHIEGIAIPQIGGGLGGLDFDKDVFPIIKEEFKDTKLKKVVVTYGMSKSK